MSDVVGRTCPFCQTPFKPVDKPVYCSKCGLPHHERCWQENGACTTFGCDGQPINYPKSGAGNSNGHIDLTLDDFSCPNCRTSNPISSRFCKQCGREQSQTSSPPPASGVTYTPAQQASAQYPQGPTVVTNVPNYLWQAIFCTICCCLPGGIVAIVYAAQVNGKLQAGDYNGAIASSNNAMMWCWISGGVGLLIVIFYVFAGLGR